MSGRSRRRSCGGGRRLMISDSNDMVGAMEWDGAGNGAGSIGVTI
jgi:hypothetical protein